MSRMISADRSLLAYTTPSARTSLPSASVLFISTVLHTQASSFVIHSYSQQAAVKTLLLSRVEGVNIVGSCGDGPNGVFSQAKHSVEVVLESLTRTERGVKSDVVKRRRVKVETSAHLFDSCFESSQNGSSSTTVPLHPGHGGLNETINQRMNTSI